MRTLKWRHLQAIALEHGEFNNDSEILNEIERHGEYLVFVNNSNDEDREYSVNGRVRIESIDTCDSNLPIKADSARVCGDSWFAQRHYHDKWVVVPRSVFSESSETQPSTQTISGEKLMANTRRTVRIELIDNDAGLDVQHALVAAYDNIMTEDDDATTIQELIMTKDIARKLREHNERRAAQVDLDVLKRTGNEVMLQPVKLKDLTWVVK
ncbi:hypothetical protein [Vibrio phage PhiImVa-1]|nr:hypothetical protein [Vibrio phage PhiImVa-1]